MSNVRPHMGNNWVRGVLYGLALVACFVAFGLIQGYRLQTRLAKVRAGRNDPTCRALCRTGFPNVKAERVDAAYNWVQSLVAIERVPLMPEDDVEAMLGIDQGEIDAKFEASYEYYGEEIDRGPASRAPVRTVKDLMAVVLAAGYENYPNAQREASAESAA
jgi:hypothetical protein